MRASERWDEEVTQRLADPAYSGRYVEVSYRRGPDKVEVTIVDEGDGFDWEKYLEIDPARAFDTHGRGIAMSRMISFDHLEYRGCGNEVAVQIFLEPSAEEQAA